MRRVHPAALTIALFVLPSLALAADVIAPASVAGLSAERTGGNVALQWSAVTTDILGNAETVSSYRVYRGEAPDFVPDTSGGSNRIGTRPPRFLHATPARPQARRTTTTSSPRSTRPGNESGSRAPARHHAAGALGLLDRHQHRADLDAAAPADKVGPLPRVLRDRPAAYDFVKEVGSATSTSMTGLACESTGISRSSRSTSTATSRPSRTSTPTPWPGAFACAPTTTTTSAGAPGTARRSRGACSATTAGS